MAVTFSRNLKLRLDSNLTANSRYNLERLDLLGSTFVVDTENDLNIRSQTNVTIEPQSTDVGGSGTGGSLSIGSAGHLLDSVNIYTQELNLGSALGLLDQATGGTRYLGIQYKSDIDGSADFSSDRILSIDVGGSSRNLVLGGNILTSGGSISLSVAGNSSLILPLTGTLATLAGSEALTNKSIDASTNTITGITNSSISASAGITYTRLFLTNSIVDSDISASANISYSKINLSGSITNSDINSNAAIARSKLAAGSANHILINDGSGLLSSTSSLGITQGGTGASTAANAINNLLPSQSGNSGKFLYTDGSAPTWQTAAGSGIGTVTSVAVSVPSGLSVSGSPITSSGTIGISLDSQVANSVWAGPLSGSPDIPAFRALSYDDIYVTGNRALSDEWVTADGTTKTIVHGWGTRKVDVQVLDSSDNYATIELSSIQRPTNSAVVLTSTQAPQSMWAVLLKEIP